MSDQTTAAAGGVAVIGTYSVLKLDGALEYLAWGILIILGGWAIHKVLNWWGEETEEEKKPTVEAQAKAPKKAKPVEPPDPEEE